MNKDINFTHEDEKRLVETQNKPEDNHSSDKPVNEHYDRPNLPSNTNLFDLEGDVKNDLLSRWASIQAQFVDQPCTSIEQADALVADALERIQLMLTKQHGILRDRWYDHEDVSTEDLRITLQDYRSFLNSILDQK